MKTKNVTACPPCVELLKYAVTKFFFETNANALSELSIEYRREHIKRTTLLKKNKKEPLICCFELDLGVSEEAQEKYAYNWEISISGFFKCVAPIDKQDEKDFETTLASCFSILYSSAREYLRNATSAGIRGSFILPTVSFVKYPQIQQEETEEKR